MRRDVRVLYYCRTDDASAGAWPDAPWPNARAGAWPDVCPCARSDGRSWRPHGPAHSRADAAANPRAGGAAGASTDGAAGPGADGCSRRSDRAASSRADAAADGRADAAADGRSRRSDRAASFRADASPDIAADVGADACADPHIAADLGADVRPCARADHTGADDAPPTPTPTRTPVVISSALLLGVSCDDFNATIFRLALDATIGAGDATLSTPACADLSAGGVEISTEVTVALAVAHARGHYGRGAVEAHVVSVLDASALEGHIQAIAAAHGDRRRRLGMSDVSVASVAVDTFMPTPAPTPVPTSGAPIPSPSHAPSDVPIPSPSLAPRLDAAPIPSSRPTGAPMPGSTRAPSAAHVPGRGPRRRRRRGATRNVTRAATCPSRTSSSAPPCSFSRACVRSRCVFGCICKPRRRPRTQPWSTSRPRGDRGGRVVQ